MLLLLQDLFSGDVAFLKWLWSTCEAVRTPRSKTAFVNVMTGQHSAHASYNSGVQFRPQSKELYDVEATQQKCENEMNICRF